MLPKIRLHRNGQAAHPMEAQEAEPVEAIEVATVADIEADAAEQAIVVATAAAQAADTRKVMAQAVTDLPTEEATVDPIQEDQLPVRIRTEVLADLQAENHGIRNKPENQVRRRKGFNLDFVYHN